MNLFNILANDISPTKPILFIVSLVCMFTGIIIVGNLIGEFSRVLNEIYEADFNNEIEEHSQMMESILQNLEIPEEIQNRVYQFMDQSVVKTDFIRSKQFF